MSTIEPTDDIKALYNGKRFDIEFHPTIPINKIGITCEIIKELQIAIVDGYLRHNDVVDLLFEQKFLLNMLTLPYNNANWCRLINNSLNKLIDINKDGKMAFLEMNQFAKIISIKIIK